MIYQRFRADPGPFSALRRGAPDTNAVNPALVEAYLPSSESIPCESRKTLAEHCADVPPPNLSPPPVLARPPTRTFNAFFC